MGWLVGGALDGAASEDCTGSDVLGADGDGAEDSPAEGVMIMMGGRERELVGSPGGISELDVEFAAGVVDGCADGRVSVGIDASGEEDTADDGGGEEGSGTADWDAGVEG